MAGIFPPLDRNGSPPGGNVCNGLSPLHAVIGEGPLYYKADCTTTLTDCAANSIISEILSGVDGLGRPYNANRIDNLGMALRDTVADINTRIDLKVNRSGDTMTGPLELAGDPVNPVEAATKNYVDNLTATLTAALDISLRAYIDQQDAAITTELRARIDDVDARKINRAGDTMAGPLILARAPVLSMEATTKAYVDERVATGGGGGGPGGGIPEAPYDDQIYGRINHDWHVLLDDGEYT